ncbi:MAG: protein kinase domain-containing protein, partial [Planctomycetota bacterium]
MTDILLDRFRIRNRFEGGMGILWAVTDKGTGQPYAVKTIRDGRNDLTDRFAEEAQTWIALGRHPNLVQAFWLIEDAGRPYLVLEYVEGRNLRDLLDADGPLDLGRALDLAMQIARGMAYAHSCPLEELGGVGVVHRDLKPE